MYCNSDHTCSFEQQNCIPRLLATFVSSLKAWYRKTLPIHQMIYLDNKMHFWTILLVSESQKDYLNLNNHFVCVLNLSSYPMRSKLDLGRTIYPPPNTGDLLKGHILQFLESASICSLWSSLRLCYSCLHWNYEDLTSSGSYWLEYSRPNKRCHFIASLFFHIENVFWRWHWLFKTARNMMTVRVRITCVLAVVAYPDDRSHKRLHCCSSLCTTPNP